MRQNKKLHGRMRWVSVEVGLLILSVAFVVSFFGDLNVSVGLSDYSDLIVILEANPNRYWSYMQEAVIFLILPPAVGLTFSITGFVRERKSPTGVLSLWLPLMVFGAFFFFWGLLGLRAVYTSYCAATHWIDLYYPTEIADLILPIYATALVGKILWVFAGVLFIFSPMFKMLLNKKRKTTKFS
jgi:hypothetical protein